MINDAYNGNELIKDFLNVDFLHSLKSKLRSDGVYITNILSSLEGENSYILKNGVNSLKEVFNNVFVFTCSNSSNVNSINNNIVLATDKSINIEDFNLDTKDVKKFN
jgi:spermidine synthase